MTDSTPAELVAAMQELTKAITLHSALLSPQLKREDNAPRHLSSKLTMRHFDLSCIRKTEKLSPAEIRAIRLNNHVSQTVFAIYLNVSKNLISDWERGVKNPGGRACGS